MCKKAVKKMSLTPVIALFLSRNATLRDRDRDRARTRPIQSVTSCIRLEKEGLLEWVPQTFVGCYV